MKVGGILLARLDSSRLPGKQLKTVSGKCLMDYILERVMLIRGIDQIVLATSDRSIDNPLAEWAQENSIKAYLGPLEDVALRVLDCSRHFKFDAFVRLNCDSPLMDFDLFSKGIKIYKNGNFDIVTNTFPRSYPIGNSVEIVSVESFARAYNQMNSPDHFEHVTSYLYQNSKNYHLYNLKREGPSLEKINLAVDTPEDFERFKLLIEAMKGNHLIYTGKKLIHVYRSLFKECDN